MCADEKIPSVNRIQHILDALEDCDQIDELADVYTIDNPSLNADSLVETANFTIENTDSRDLIDHPARRDPPVRIPFSLPEDYENIFLTKGLSRRTARPLPNPLVKPEVGEDEFMYDWGVLCFKHTLRMFDTLIAEGPEEREAFDEILQHYLPERLGLHSWIGQNMMIPLAESVGEGAHKYDFKEWQPWMGTQAVETRLRPKGDLEATIHFLGVPERGHLVYAPRSSPRRPYTDENIEKFQNIQAKIRHAESALVAFARRIARYVLTLVVEEYAEPEAEKLGRPVLDRKQIGRAVREILGDAWFDLPYDVEGSLRNWSEDSVLKPDGDLTGSPYIGED